jgi:hypothetical protein
VIGVGLESTTNATGAAVAASTTALVEALALFANTHLDVLNF